MQKVKEKRERTLGVKLFLKADRCNSPKCVMVRRPYRPGIHGQKPHSLTDYGKQLHEKQKIQFYYGLNNRQMAALFKKAKSPGEVVAALEHRLDHVVLLLGFAKSTRIARQLVSHGHILVSGRKMTIPSYRVRVGDVIEIRPESRRAKIFDDLAMRLKSYEPPDWLKLDKDNLKGECVREVDPQLVALPLDINLVGQFYSR
jgi:small subunit ribosomal protein S4